MATATALGNPHAELGDPAIGASVGGVLAPGHDAPPAPDFVAELVGMSPAQRLAAYRAGLFSLRQAMTWAARFPEEVPIVNGEFEWIALTLADLD